jgi:hypothetical protein
MRWMIGRDAQALDVCPQPGPHPAQHLAILGSPVQRSEGTVGDRLVGPELDQ